MGDVRDSKQEMSTCAKKAAREWCLLRDTDQEMKSAEHACNCCCKQLDCEAASEEDGALESQLGSDE